MSRWPLDSPGALAHGHPARDDEAEDGASADDTEPPADAGPTEDRHAGDALIRFARRARELGGSDVGLTVRATPRQGDTAVSVAVVTPTRTVRQRRLVFLGGANGRSRAALSAASILLEALREEPPGD